MRQEIVDLRQTVDAVKTLLERGAEFTGIEEDEIGSCTGTLRTYLDKWRKLMAAKRKAT